MVLIMQNDRLLRTPVAGQRMTARALSGGSQGYNRGKDYRQEGKDRVLCWRMEGREWRLLVWI